MAPRWLVLVPLTACSFELPDAPQDSRIDAPPDAEIDASPDVPPDAAGFCFGDFTQVCLQALPDQAITFSTDTTIDTTAGSAGSPLCAAGATPAGVCVVAGLAVTVPMDVTVTGIGARPLVLVATSGAITVAGTIDTSSHRIGDTAGAGFGAGPCSAGQPPGGGGGGQGGSFAGGGGDGGHRIIALTDTNGGVAGATQLLGGSLRGGCAGANGSGLRAGDGGRGGGAVELISAVQITVSGEINSSGAGGDPGLELPSIGAFGGGGGGSGGAIVLAAPQLTVSGRLFANGGGGGEGSKDSRAGNPGKDPSPPAIGDGGSLGTTSGGDGGDGSGRPAAGNPDETGERGQNGPQAGGGGGGGGAGVIHTTAPAPNTSGLVSPPFS